MAYAGSGSRVTLLGLRTRFRVLVGENLGVSEVNYFGEDSCLLLRMPTPH